MTWLTSAARRRIALAALAATAISVVLTAEGRASTRPVGKSAPASHAQSNLAREFSVSPLVNSTARRFVASKEDLARSDTLGRVVVPLVVLLLIEAELLTAGGRPGGRMVRAFAVPLLALFLILVLVRFHAYRS